MLSKRAARPQATDEKLTQVAVIAEGMLQPTSQSRFGKALRLFPGGRHLTEAIDIEKAALKEFGHLSQLLEEAEVSTKAWPERTTYVVCDTGAASLLSPQLAELTWAVGSSSRLDFRSFRRGG